MYKIVCFLRDLVVVPIGIGFFSQILFAKTQYMLGIWLGIIDLVIILIPLRYLQARSYNHAFMDRIENRVMRKKVRLNSFWKKFFLGYNRQDEMLWWVLIIQSVLTVYVFEFVLLNIIFIITLAFGMANSTIWMKIWIFEFNLFSCIIIFTRIIMWICSYCFHLKEKKENKNKNKFRIGIRGMIKNDMKIIKNQRIVKQKIEFVDFLKQYGLCVDKHSRYFINNTEVNRVEEILSKEYPDLCITFTKSEKGKQLFNVYNKKDDCFWVKAYIKNN